MTAMFDDQLRSSCSGVQYRLRSAVTQIKLTIAIFIFYLYHTKSHFLNPINTTSFLSIPFHLHV